MGTDVTPLNVALVGTGFMGRAHSNAWMSVNKFFDVPRDVVMHTVCGSDLGQAEAFAERWGWQHATADVDDVVGNGEIDLVDVTTPNDLHRVHATAALAAGKHVFIEKPIATTPEQALQLIELASEADVKVQVGHVERFNPCFRRLLQEPSRR